MDVPLLEDEEIRQTSAAPADIESGLSGDRAGSEAGASNKTEEDRQIEEVCFVVLTSLSDVDAGIVLVLRWPFANRHCAASLQAARASYQSGAAVYCIDIFRLAIFYWAIVADALLLKVCSSYFSDNVAVVVALLIINLLL